MNNSDKKMAISYVTRRGNINIINILVFNTILNKISRIKIPLKMDRAITATDLKKRIFLKKGKRNIL